MADQLKATVITPEGPVFKGDVASLSSVNAVGPFDILPRHGSFITLVERLIVVRPVGQPTVTIPIDKGVLRCRNNNIVIYIGLTLDLSLRPDQVVATTAPVQERH